MSSSDRPVRVFIVEDREIERLGLKHLLSQSPAFKVVGEAAEAPNAIEQISQQKPDVVIMDLSLPGMDGIEAARLITAWTQAPKVMLLATEGRGINVADVLGCGATAFAYKSVSGPNLSIAVAAAASGAVWLDPAVAGEVLRAAVRGYASARREPVHRDYGLSNREIEILRLVVEGGSNQQIADLLLLSAWTVKTHVRHILEKLIVHDRTQAAVKALQEKLVESARTAQPSGCPQLSTHQVGAEPH